MRYYLRYRLRLDYDKWVFLLLLFFVILYRAKVLLGGTQSPLFCSVRRGRPYWVLVGTKVI